MKSIYRIIETKTDDGHKQYSLQERIAESRWKTIPIEFVSICHNTYSTYEQTTVYEDRLNILKEYVRTKLSNDSYKGIKIRNAIFTAYNGPFGNENECKIVFEGNMDNPTSHVMCDTEEELYRQLDEIIEELVRKNKELTKNREWFKIIEI